MADTCKTCRFWRVDPEAVDDLREQDMAHGWCRRFPPRVSDHMAQFAIGPARFGGFTHDPEDIASVERVHQATLFPASFSDGWCGEHRLGGEETSNG